MTPVRNQFDLAWKEALTRYLPEFLALFKPEVHDAVDWSQKVEFLESETRRLQSPRPAPLRGQRRVVDLLARVALARGANALLLVHVEVQAQRDSLFDVRMRIYNDRLFDQIGLPVYSLAVLIDGDPDWRPQRHETTVFDCRSVLEFPVVKLLDWRDRRAELEASSNPFALVAAATVAVLETRPDQEARRERAVRIVRLLLERGFPRHYIGGLFRILEVMMPMSDRLRESFVREVSQLEKKHGVQLVSPLESYFTRKGRKEGLVEGRRELIRAILVGRFGELPASLEQELDTVTSEEVLDGLGLQAATVKSVQEFADRMGRMR